MGSDSSCVISEESNAADESPIIMSPSIGKYSSERFITRFPDIPHCSTLFELFEYTKSIAPNNDLYGKRVYSNGKWQDSYSFVNRVQFSEMRDSIGSFLVSSVKSNNNHIGILSYNRIEWVVAQHACFAFGFVPVPIYDTFGWDNIKFIVEHAQITHIFIISTKVKQMLTALKEIEFEVVLIVIDSEETRLVDIGIDNDSKNVKLLPYNEVLRFADRYPYRPPTPDTPASIMYTSGTTGSPKGCILTHGNFISAAASYIDILGPIQSTDSLLSYLPLAHILESILHVVAIKVLGRVGFYSGSVTRLVEEIRVFKPTVFVGVTRVYERIMEGIKAQIQNKSWFIQYLFSAAFSSKSFLTNNFRIQKCFGLDLVFSSIKEALGGNVRLMIAGGSALHPDIQHWLRIACNVSFVQGYGLTESCAAALVQRPSDIKNDNVGVIAASCEAKLRDVPEYGYYARDNIGELLLRGPGIFKGYIYQEQETQNSFVSGWFITGDIFQLTPSGQMKVISRRKDLVKLAQGEYIAIQKLSDIYTKSKYVSQIYIHAGMHSRFLAAIVVLKEGIDNVNESTVIQSLDELAQQRGLNGFEKIKAVHLTRDQFSPENGLLTPSLKLCRYKVQQKYQTIIAELEKRVA